MEFWIEAALLLARGCWLGNSSVIGAEIIKRNKSTLPLQPGLVQCHEGDSLVRLPPGDGIPLIDLDRAVAFEHLSRFGRQRCALLVRERHGADQFEAQQRICVQTEAHVAHRRNREKLLRYQGGVAHAARATSHELYLPTPDAANDRHVDAAVARLAPFGHVADIVADQRHGLAVQRRDQHPARLPDPAGLSGIIDNFDDDVGRHDMKMLVARTLNRQPARFFVGIAIHYPGAKRLLAIPAKFLGDGFTCAKKGIDP